MTNNTMVAFYATQDQAKDAIVKLDNGGFDTKFSSIVVTKHEVLKNSHKVKIGNFMLMLYGSPAELNTAATLLQIPLEKDVVNADGTERVLSGGETSPFQ
jgi:hypothetical protein